VKRAVEERKVGEDQWLIGNCNRQLHLHVICRRQSNQLESHH